MNTQVGKSVGIALLLAAGLLAVLFAFGIFSPKGAGADVKLDPKVEYDLSTHIPDSMDVTLEVVFQVDADVTSDGRNVVITLPDSIDGDDDFDADIADGWDISVTQNGDEVGLVTTTLSTGGSGQGKIVTIATPTAEGAKVLLANTRTVLTIENLEISSSAVATTAEDLRVQQPLAQTASEAVGNLIKITFGSSVTAGTVNVSPKTAGADDVTLTLTFTADTASEEAAVLETDGSAISSITPGTDVITIVVTGIDLPTAEPVTTGSPPATTTPPFVAINNASDEAESVIVNAGTNTITVSGFGAADEDGPFEVEIEFEGLTNRGSATKIVAEFKHGDMAEPLEDVDYVTKASDVAINDLTLDPRDAGAEGATMTFNFVPQVDDDEAIVITLAAGYEYVAPDEDDEDAEHISVYQMDDDVKVDLDFTSDNDPVSIRIMGNDDDDDGGVGLDRDLDEIFVSIPNLTNTDAVGTVSGAATIQQGNFAPQPADVRQTGVQVSTTTAGAAAQVKISTIAEEAIRPGEDINVKLPGFILPDSIDKDQILFDGGGTADDGSDGFYGLPGSVTVGKDAVTLVIPISYPNGDRVKAGVVKGNVFTITFKLGAGLKNQTVKRGDRGIGASVSTITETNTDVTSKVASGAASRGETHTFSVVGLKAGSATIYLRVGDCIDVMDDCSEDNDFRIGYGLQEDGKVEVERRVTSTLFRANDGPGPTELNAAGTALIGTNVIYSVDGTGVLSDAHGRFTITPTVEVAPDSIKQGGLLELEVSDWYYGDIEGLEVGGVEVNGDVEGRRSRAF